MKLEDVRPGAEIKGVLPSGVVSVVAIKWHGSEVLGLTYKDVSGRLGNELIYRDREPTLEIVTEGRAWSFIADGAKLRLVSEAHRIRLAYLFDPDLPPSALDASPHGQCRGISLRRITAPHKRCQAIQKGRKRHHINLENTANLRKEVSKAGLSRTCPGRMGGRQVRRWTTVGRGRQEGCHVTFLHAL